MIGAVAHPSLSPLVTQSHQPQFPSRRHKGQAGAVGLAPSSFVIRGQGMVCHRSPINDGDSISSHRPMINNTYPAKYLSQPITSVYVALFSLSVSPFFSPRKSFVYSFVFPKNTNEPHSHAQMYTRTGIMMRKKKENPKQSTVL